MFGKRCIGCKCLSLPMKYKKINGKEVLICELCWDDYVRIAGVKSKW